jgi:hypothetical protein
MSSRELAIIEKEVGTTSLDRRTPLYIWYDLL